MDVPATQSTVTSKICNEVDERLPVLSVFPLRFESGTHTAAAHIIAASCQRPLFGLRLSHLVDRSSRRTVILWCAYPTEVSLAWLRKRLPAANSSPKRPPRRYSAGKMFTSTRVADWQKAGQGGTLANRKSVGLFDRCWSSLCDRRADEGAWPLGALR